MASRRRSEVWERKGSIERVRVERLGCKGEGRLCVGGNSESEFGILGGFMLDTVVVGVVGRVWRKEVRRWELWIWRGSSWRMSW